MDHLGKCEEMRAEERIREEVLNDGGINLMKNNQEVKDKRRRLSKILTREKFFITCYYYTQIDMRLC